jgi:ketosteroid isomerase-like protein
MKRTRSYLKITLLALLTLSFNNISIAKDQKDITMNNDINNVISTIEKMTEAFHQKNMDSILASYEIGGAIMFEPGTAISDPNMIKQMFEGAFQINPNFTYTNGHEVYIANDIAMHIAPWVMKGTAPDGTNIEKSGLSVAVLRKQENGDWLMVLDNPNTQAMMQQK